MVKQLVDVLELMLLDDGRNRVGTAIRVALLVVSAVVVLVRRRVVAVRAVVLLVPVLVSVVTIVTVVVALILVSRAAWIRLLGSVVLAGVRTLRVRRRLRGGRWMLTTRVVVLIPLTRPMLVLALLMLPVRVGSVLLRVGHISFLVGVAVCRRGVDAGPAPVVLSGQLQNRACRALLGCVVWSTPAWLMASMRGWSG